MFVEPPHIPRDALWTIYYILHNELADWVILDGYEKDQVLEWVCQILRANGSEITDEEIKWWQEQLSK